MSSAAPSSPSRAATAPTASYRLQLTPEFGFDAAAAVLDTLVALGVSHVYLSPIAEAVPGSQHGYDVTDHARVREEFGGSNALDRLLDVAHDRGLGVIVDHVPNHVSIERADLNHPWWTMLREGSTSWAARWFDVDWELTGGRVIIPKLGDPLDQVVADGGLVVGDGDLGPELRYGPLRFPLAAGTAELPLDELLEYQHYRLVHWRSPERNVRRFFTIDDLVAVCVEHAEVADVVDTIPRRLVAHPAFAGVRVDHVDGLADPEGYLRNLRQILGDRLLFVEKIVAPGERLPESWPVEGTTGYEHIVAVEHVLLDPAAEGTLLADWRERTGPTTFEELDREARCEVLDGGLRPDLDRVVRAVDRVDGGAGTSAAVTALTLALDRYRTYLPDEQSGPIFDEVVERAREASDDDARQALDRVVAVIASDPSARTLWQQLTGPAMAKGVEDRAFYRWFPLASLSEVGGTPETFSTSVSAFHDQQRERQATSQMAMLADTTHDTKRSSAVRSRSLALAANTGRWSAASGSWIDEHADRFAPLDPGIVSLALQTAITARPLDAARLEAYLVKAAREGDQITSWTEPDAEVEGMLSELANALVADVGQGLLADLAGVIEAQGDEIGLRVLALQLTCPGFADLYQGSPRRLLSLVDPDNRRPPDWDGLAALVGRNSTSDTVGALAGGDADLARSVLTERVLRLRHRRPEAFAHSAGYAEVEVSGPDSEHVIAFARTADELAVSVTVVVRATSRPINTSAIDLTMPSGTWRSIARDGAPLVDAGPTRLSEILGPGGFDVLESTDS